ncbi:5-oxoprolinase subunit PxpA [Microbulbifer sp. SAOS-129_SWC]|uniref:5-oxoprolinase subunit PxpA n=1 Tax=Microbulbifer sp. SAOS-129_SWC TaxID=3145235 RepID=UPI0032173B9E
MKLNCDLGEGFGNWQLVDERTVMPHIDMANVACGFHAGDPVGIRRTVRLARECGVNIGAHPAYPDLVGFGRRSMDCSADEITAMVLYQLGALRALCTAEQAQVEYLKPHGALYNDMMRNDAVLRAILAALASAGEPLPLLLMATPDSERYRALAAEYGVPLLFEAFADRRYRADGRLQPRAEDGAVLHDTGDIVRQVEGLCRGEVVTADGTTLQLAADTICVHGDNPAGVATIVEIRRALDS